MVIKFRDRRINNGDIVSQVFIGDDVDHLQLSGELHLHVGEWQLLGAALLMGARQTFGQLEVLFPDDKEILQCKESEE